MVEFFIGIYCLYFFVKLYVSFMQFDFVKKIPSDKPVILDLQNFMTAKNYSLEKEKLSITSSFFDFLVFMFWIYFGLAFLDGLLNIDNPYMKAVVFIDSFIVLNWIFGLPFDIYQTFNLDKKYGFSTITKEIFVKDTIKSGILFFIFGSVVIFALAYIISNLTNWWIWGFALMFGVILLINMLYPVIRDKMFDKFEPLESEELNQKINTLLSSVGFLSSGIFSVDASKRDNRLNAYFGGLGKTKRVVLFDTLLQKLTHNELLAVLGHELGHFKNGDIKKNIAIMGLIMFGVFAIFGNLPDELFMTFGLLNEPSSVLAIILIFSTPIFFFLMPIISLFSRHNEYAADRFGSSLQSKEDLVNALLKLANENKSFPLSHKTYIFFYYSHPPLVERLKVLGYDIGYMTSEGYDKKE